jgi:poly(3-hydroxybutyrate) depolymerase
LAAILILAEGVPGTVVAKGKIRKESVVSVNKKRSYYLYSPEKLTATKSLPLIIMLHGSNRSGSSLVEKWTEIAEREQLMLAGPDATQAAHWSFASDGPELFRDLVEDLKSKYPVDQKRVYLFGHSAGAIYALMMGLIESEYFAAVAVHAGALRQADYALFDSAKRKIPVALFVGEKDPFFPLTVVKATREAFASRQFPVEFTAIPNHDHWYYDKASKINEQVWSFLKAQALSEEPRYEQYQIKP